ncbi:MAG: cyclomaltodextrinase, partial [Yoonia sp.]
MKTRFTILMSAFLLLSCAEAPAPVELKPAPKTPPQWSKEAIWYQIMVERFHNGDPTNDPTIASIQGT